MAPEQSIDQRMHHFAAHSRLSIATLVLGFVLLSTFFTPNAHAQILSHGDFFGPGAPPPLVGVEIGLGKHAQQGSFDALCGCTFEGGSGSGFLGNLLFELPLDYEWTVGVKAGIDFKNTTSTTSLLEGAVISVFGSVKDSNITNGSIAFNRIGYVKTTYLAIVPFVQYQFFRNGPFVQTGLGVSLLLSNQFTHTRELTSTSATIPDPNKPGQTITVDNLRFTNGTRDETLQDGQITAVNGMRLGLSLAAGYNIAFSERSVFTPMLTYDFPLSTLSDASASGWKIGSLYGSVELKFKLN